VDGREVRLKNRTLAKTARIRRPKNPLTRKAVPPVNFSAGESDLEAGHLLPKNVAERRKAVLDFIEHGLFLLNPNSHCQDEPLPLENFTNL
jgi:hypothetical protein